MAEGDAGTAWHVVEIDRLLEVIVIGPVVVVVGLQGDEGGGVGGVGEITYREGAAARHSITLRSCPEADL